MNNTIKVILGFLLAAVLTCVLTCVLIGVLGLTFFNVRARSVLRDVQAQPGEASSVAQEIADFTLPEGYTSAVATQFAHFEVVGYDGPDGNSHLYLFQMPPALNVDQAELERYLRSATESEGNDYGPDMQVIDQLPVTIRGQATTLIVSEGTNGAGELFRSANAAFQGRDSQALLSFSGPTAQWDTAMIEAFIGSMK
jgi:hypothetical protein